MLLDEYKKLNEQDAPSQEEIEADKIFQEDYEAIVEFLRESGYAELEDEYSVYTEATYTTNKMTGKQRVKSKAEYEAMVRSMAAIAEGRRRNDPMVAKLSKVSRLRKKLIAQLNKKYAGVARKTAKQALKDAKKVSQTVVKAPKEGVSGTKTKDKALKPKVVDKADKK